MDSVEQLLLKNLQEIFGEADSAQRAKAIAETWATDGELIDAQGRYVGHAAISGAVAALHARFPGFVFRPIGLPQTFHDVGRLAWGFGPQGALPQISGLDVARVHDGLIVTLYAFVDDFSQESADEH